MVDSSAEAIKLTTDLNTASGRPFHTKICACRKHLSNWDVLYLRLRTSNRRPNISNSMSSREQFIIQTDYHTYPEWPNRQGSCLACWRLQVDFLWGCSDLYYAWGYQGVLPIRVWSETSQLVLPSLTPLSVAGCGRLQLGVTHWATSVDFCKKWIILITKLFSRFLSTNLLSGFQLPTDCLFQLFVRQVGSVDRLCTDQILASLDHRRQVARLCMHVYKIYYN